MLMLMNVVVPLAGLILARDIGLVISAFYYRYRTLPPPVSIPLEY
jgi:hypothetical protein